MAVQLRSGKELEKKKEKNDSNKEEESPEEEEALEKKKEGVDRKDIKGSRLAVPCPQRLQKSKIEEQFTRFLKTFQKLEISMPFTEAVTEMPLYAKFMKDMLSKKRKIVEEGIVNLTATCSAVMKKELPEKMKDLGSFTIPCIIGGIEIQKALCDSGASINLMPLSVAKQLSLGEFIPTSITLQMADRCWTDHFPFPFIDQMLDRLAGHLHFCFLDGYSGYNQIAIAPEDQEKTTFTCPYGTFAFRRMPFELCNAPATFQRCMMSMFSDLVEKVMEIFMDDFTVYGSSFDQCLKNLETVLQRCQDKQLALNWEKCHFMVTEGIVLGHKISSTGLEVDQSKVSII